MMCALMDPIHIHEMPRLCYNVILNSVNLPIFFVISIFQREMEVPTLPLESVVDFFTHGKVFACCRKHGIQTWQQSAANCKLGKNCHTKRVRDMLMRMLNHRAWLPVYSGVSLNFVSNCSPYMTTYGNQEDCCDMSPHKSAVTKTSCMRFRLLNSSSSSGRGSSRWRSGEATENAAPETSFSQQQQQVEMGEAYRTFAKLCFQQYRPLAECAMITEPEFMQCMEEFMAMTTKFVQFFGDMAFFGQHLTVLKDLGIPSPPSCFQNITHKQVFESGVPIVQVYISLYVYPCSC